MSLWTNFLKNVPDYYRMKQADYLHRKISSDIWILDQVWSFKRNMGINICFTVY